MASVQLGPASKGSQYCLRRYIDLRPDALADQIISASPALMAFGPGRVDWRSPLQCDGYLEYRDDFLRVLGFGEHEEALRYFWPLRGPQWDGLALLPTETATGILLVEAKAHPAETDSDCAAKHPTSIEQIRAAFGRVQRHMGATPTDWTKGSYQLANRLAFLYFLNEIAQVPTFLALVNFVDDQSHQPTSLAEWRSHYQALFRTLGLHPGCRMLDRIVTLFPEPVA
jgi:hypothetical protein